MTAILKSKVSLVGVMVFFMMLAQAVFAADMGTAKHKIVIQVSTDDPITQQIALNNAVNVQKIYGMDNIDIEIVGYGPGLSLLTKASTETERVKSLSLQNIRFSACGNTMAGIEKKTGKKPVLTDGVQTVDAGVARIMELQQQGYSYLRP